MQGKMDWSPLRLYALHRPLLQQGLSGEHVDLMAGFMRETLEEIGTTPSVTRTAVDTLLNQRWIFAPGSGLEEQWLAREEERTRKAAESLAAALSGP